MTPAGRVLPTEDSAIPKEGSFYGDTHQQSLNVGGGGRKVTSTNLGLHSETLVHKNKQLQPPNVRRFIKLK